VNVHLDKCIFHPAMFSPLASFDGVVYTDGKMLPPPLWVGRARSELGRERVNGARCAGLTEIGGRARGPGLV
jgi:hypothetical protein